MKKILTAFVILNIMYAAAPINGQALKSEKEKFSYAMAMNIMLSFKAQEIEVDEKAFNRAVKDVLGNKKTKLTENEMKSILQSFSQKHEIKKQAKAMKDFEVEKKSGLAFHEKKKKEKGVTTLPSGLQYKIIKKGKGKKPSIDSTVKVHYEGTLVDGKVFDSSYKRGEPAVFPLKGVIRGWTEALQLMTEGSIWEVYLPESLAYGKNAPPGSIIKAGSTLVFKIELLSIEK